MVESGLVGQLVECPDCGNKIQVPDIRDGLNPRFKPEDGGPEIPAPVSEVRSDASPDLLIENLQSLYRIRKEQGRQMEHIRKNAELCVKQIHLLGESSTEKDPPTEKTTQSEVTGSEEGRSFVFLSMGFAILTLFAGAVVLVLMKL